MKIIGFQGKMGVGKNYIAQTILPSILPHHTRIFYFAFADQVKIEWLRKHPTYTFDDVFITKQKEVRRSIQEYATHERDRNPNTWIDTLHNHIQLIRHNYSHQPDILPTIVIVITDVRFQNEVEWIQKVGGRVYHILAPKRTHEYTVRMKYETAQTQHCSETDLDNISYDGTYLVHNDYDSTSESIRQEIIAGLNDFMIG